MGSVKVQCLVAVLVAMVLVADGAVSCNSVFSYLGPCVPYLRVGGKVPTACCGGIKSVNGMAKTTPDRQAVCGCLKQAVTGIRGINYSLAQGLPKACGVSIPYTLSPSTDCSKIK
ncbi:hypothetical protein AMTRI_Chr08g168040 [Amborella trichopoda]